MAGSRRFITGGQTGVDRGVLDACLELGFPCGGWCPRGRLAEDGIIPARYPLRETAAAEYAVRTERNLLEADGVVILGHGPLTGGTRLSQELAIDHARPHLVRDLTDPVEETIAAILAFLAGSDVRVLDWSGPRASESGLAHTGARAVARGVIDALRAGPGRFLPLA